ncbi:MAG TPA: DNA-3-methyladenine glycosylase [Patescibacteria group bacterium]|nr:DNA-3-methyladenine glycosylase [Patescibacteria group bacterium]
MFSLKHQNAIKFLRKDPILKKIIDADSFPIFEDRSNDLFASLIRSIANQQLSGKAADTILGRFLNLFGNKFPKPEEILKKTDDEIRAVGFSYPKVRYIKGLASMVVKKEIDLKKLPKLKDEEVIAELIKIKGVGKWTAEMILIFSLGRPDIFSLGDLGLVTAVSRLYKIDRKNLKKIEKISIGWSPYRSVASWYLWKSLDNRPKV